MNLGGVKPMIKLIATDMDGTLLKSNGEVPHEFPKVLNNLIGKKIMFCIASGRQYFTLKDNMSKFSNKLIFIAENGAFIVKNGQELFSKTLDKNMMAEILKDIKKIPECFPILCGKKSAYVLDKNPEFIKEVSKYYHKNTIVDNFEDIDDEFFKIAVCDFKGSANNCSPILFSKWSKSFQLAVSGDIWLDIGRNDVNKGIAIKFLQNKFKINKNETMAFGDYYNDVSMLKSVYHSYVMENAPDGVKKQGRFIAKSNDEAGVLQVIKNNVLAVQ